MDESPHCALSGGAFEFARSLEKFDGICEPSDLKGDYPNQQITTVTNQDFRDFTNLIIGGEPVQSVDQQQAHDNAGAEAAGVVERQDDQAHDTVGAVAIDRKGFLACANSTGV